MHQNILGLSSNRFYTLPPLLNEHKKGRYTPNTLLFQKQVFTDFLQNRCSDKLCKFHKKTPLLKSFFGKIPGLKAWNFIKARLHNKYFPVKFAQFKKKTYLQTSPVLFKPRFYSLITAVLFFTAIIATCNHGSLFKKVIKMIFFILFFAIIYPKISMNVAKTISPWQIEQKMIFLINWKGLKLAFFAYVLKFFLFLK